MSTTSIQMHFPSVHVHNKTVKQLSPDRSNAGSKDVYTKVMVSTSNTPEPNLTPLIPHCSLSIQTCGSPVTQPARVKEGYLRPYHHYKKSRMFTRTRQANYVQTMQLCLQSCALFHSLHPTPSGLADLPSCSKIIC